MLTEEGRAKRLLGQFAGMVRKQKARLRDEMAGGVHVAVNNDRPARWEAAKQLVELGFAVLIEKGPRRIGRGPRTNGGERRVRKVMVITTPGGEVRPEARLPSRKTDRELATPEAIEARRRAAADEGMIRVQRDKLRGLLARGRPVSIQVDRKMRYAAAMELVRTGHAAVLKRGARTIAKGPARPDGSRRQVREVVIVLAQPADSDPDDMRI